MSKVLEKFLQLNFMIINTEIALVKVTNDLLLTSDSRLVSILVLLDLSAVFETIDHNILLQRLQRVIGIKGTG